MRVEGCSFLQGGLHVSLEPGRLAGTWLTPIHRRIHCAATQDTSEEYSETDLIIVNNFLNTLAEVALAVAARNAQRQDDRD